MMSNKTIIDGGWDFFIPPMPKIPRSLQTSATENWNYKALEVQSYIDRINAAGGPKKKILFVGFDTGAKSNSKYLQKNFLDYGKDWTDENNPVDQHGHFSHRMSSIAGSHPSGTMGLLTLIPDDYWKWTGEKMLRSTGGGTWTWGGNAWEGSMVYCKEWIKKNGKGSVIWGNSYGGFGSSSVMDQIASRATELGMIIVSSAGNSGDAGVTWPATQKDTIAIAAMDKNRNVASFSSKGEDVDFAAGGVSVWGALDGVDETAFWSGTSMASPNAEAAIGLILMANPDIESTSDLMEVIKANVTDIMEVGEDDSSGMGAIILGNKFPVPDPVPDPDPEPDPVPDPEPDPDPVPDPEPDPDPVPDPEPDPDPVPDPDPIKTQPDELVFEIPTEFTVSWRAAGGPPKRAVLTITPKIKTKRFVDDIWPHVNDDTNEHFRSRGYFLSQGSDLKTLTYYIALFYKMIVAKYNDQLKGIDVDSITIQDSSKTGAKLIVNNPVNKSSSIDGKTATYVDGKWVYE